MNTQNDQNDRPLGYWLRTVDGLLTREFSAAFEAEGVSRRDWMLLSILSGDVDAPRFGGHLARKAKRLRALADRGWVEEQGDGTWTLTDDGRAAKERLAGIVDGIRARVAGAVGPEEFDALTASLQAIARELGWDENTADGFGRGFRPRGFGRRGFAHHGFGPGHGYGPGHGFAPDGHHGHAAHAGHEAHAGHAAHHGCHGQGGHHGHEGRRHGGHRHAERAYERGFDAGFARGRAA